MDAFVARLTSLGFVKKGGCGRHSDGNVCEEYVAGDHYVHVFGLSKDVGESKDVVLSKDVGLSSPNPNEGFMAEYTHVNWMDLGGPELEKTHVLLRVEGDGSKLSKYNYSRPEVNVSATLEVAKGTEAFFQELRVRLSS